MVLDVVKVILPATLAFGIGMLCTPFLTHYLYKYKAWKKHSVQKTLDGDEATISRALHRDEEKKTPRMGGIVIWISSGITVLGIWMLAQLFPTDLTSKLDFLSRSQTWLPLFTLFAGSIVGLADDILEVRGSTRRAAGGLSLFARLSFVMVVALFVALWFFVKLEVSSIGIPFFPDLEIGILFLPLFVLVALAIYAAGVIDGIDGLSGGVFATIFATYATIAFAQQQIDLAAFAATVTGAILAFLWFNIPPARFYMSETGTMGLTITLTTIAFMTDTLGGGEGVFVLPIIGFLLVVTVCSNIIQLASKHLRGKKVFLVAPLHHHFEAIGWPSYKVTMRYWVIGILAALVGLIVTLTG